jgi:membrane-bound lytic murein transglycosylase MltF
VKAALTDQILIRKGKIWTAKRKTDHEAIFRVSASRIFSAAGLIGLVAAGDLAVVIASVVAVDSAAIVLVAVAVAADLADLAAEDFEVAGDKNKDLN